MKKKKSNYIIALVVIYFVLVYFFNVISDHVNIKNIGTNKASDKTFKIISSTENKDIEETLKKYAKENQIDLQIDYAGTIEIMDKLNNGENYDAVWCSNSIWLYMLTDDISVKNSKSTSINPVVFGIKKSKAQELGFINNEVYTKDILNAIRENKLKFNMSSPTQTNTGASAYLGFVSTLAGNPEVLTEKDLENEQLKKELTQL